MSDFIVATTAEFDAGVKSDIATDTDIDNIPADQIQLDVDGVDDIEITAGVTQISPSFSFGSRGAEWRLSQLYTTVGDFYLTAADIYISIIYGNPGDWRFDLYSDNGSDEPGSLLTSSNVLTQGSTSTASYNKITFPTPYKMAPSTKYHIVAVVVTPTGGINDRYFVMCSNIGEYAGGHCILSKNGGGTWIQYTVWDALARLYSQDLQTSGDWRSAAQTMTAGKKLDDITINHSGLSATYYIDKIEMLKAADNSIQNTYDVDIKSGASTNLTEVELGSLAWSADENFKVKIYLAGDGDDSPIITQVEGNYIDVTKYVRTDGEIFGTGILVRTDGEVFS